MEVVTILIYGTGLDLLKGHNYDDAIEFASVEQRLTCLGFTAFHLAGVVASPLILVASIVAALAVPFFIGAIAFTNFLNGNDNKLNDITEAILVFEIVAIAGIASPILHTAAGCRALVGAIIHPTNYLN